MGRTDAIKIRDSEVENELPGTCERENEGGGREREREREEEIPIKL